MKRNSTPSGTTDSKKRTRKQFDSERLSTLAYLDATATVHYAPISKRAFYQYIADGKLRAFRVGGNGKLVVKREDLDRLLTAVPAESRLDAIVNETLRDLGVSK